MFRRHRHLPGQRLREIIFRGGTRKTNFPKPSQRQRTQMPLYGSGACPPPPVLIPFPWTKRPMPTANSSPVRAPLVRSWSRFQAKTRPRPSAQISFSTLAKLRPITALRKSLQGLQPFGNQILSPIKNFRKCANLCKVCKDLEGIFQAAEIAPAGLEAGGVAVLNEFGQRAKGVFGPPGMLVVLDAVHFDAAVVLRAGLEE